MIYIDEIDDYTIRISNLPDGAGYFKNIKKPVGYGVDELGRINGWDIRKKEQILQHEEYSNLTIDGTVHASPTLAVTALNIQAALLNYLWEWLFDSEGESLYDSEGNRLSCLKE